MGQIQTKSEMGMNQEQNMNDILEYTELMFAKNEHQFQQNFRTKQMAEVKSNSIIGISHHS